MRRRSSFSVVIVGLVLAIMGYGLLDSYGLAPGVLTRAGPPPTSVPTARGVAVTGARPGPLSHPQAPLDQVAVAAPVPTGPGLAASLHQALRDPHLGSSVGMTVRDAQTGRHLLDLGADKALTPASTTKLLTAAAVASTLDMSSTWMTKVVQGVTPHDIVLVAGGDSLLSPGAGDPHAVAGRAGLGDLAAQVSISLKGTRGAGPLRLSVDDRYAAGPAFAPGWPAGTISRGYTGAVAMLGLSTQRVVSGRPSPHDPVAESARAFRTALAEHGITVNATIGRTPASSGAKQLGAVASAPIHDVLALALDGSDNALTEQLARQAAAKAGWPATFAAVASWVQTKVKELGVNTAGMRLVDSCGLSDGTRIPVRVLGDVVELAAGGHQPALRRILSQLPVAGLSGTLHDRFLAPQAAAGRGVARAKTGSLPGVSSLAGTVVDRDGRLLVFAVVVDNIRPVAPSSAARATVAEGADRGADRPGSKGVSDNAWVAAHEARAAVDVLVTRLSQCGCR